VTPALAAALAEAKGRFPSHKDFSVWLASNEIDISGNDRAALISMAANLEVFRNVLIEQTGNAFAQHHLAKASPPFPN
jgi:hypothetical protein